MGPRVVAVLLGVLAGGCAPQGRQPVEGAPSTGLVFVRRDGDNNDLYRVRLADGAERPLLQTADRDETWPYWSQGARRLVFESRPRDGSGLERLLLLDPASGRVEPVAPEAGGRQHWATWSPDGARLAFVFGWRPGAGPDAGIAVFGLHSGRVELAAESRPRSRFYRPEFAPDGRRLVVQRGVSDQRSALWIAVPGAEPRRVTPEGRFDLKPRFTRDAAWILFTRRASRDAPGRVMRVRPDGSDAAPVVAGVPGTDDHSGRPSPVRDEVAFVSNRGRSLDAFRVALQGGRPQQLTHTPERDELAPRWSPDGAYLALTTRPAGAPPGRVAPDSRVLVIDRQGQRLLEVPGTMPDWMPAWP